MWGFDPQSLSRILIDSIVLSQIVYHSPRLLLYCCRQAYYQSVFYTHLGLEYSIVFEFHEDIQLEIPNIEDQINEFSEADNNKLSKGLIIEVAAIHEGLTANFNNYSKEVLENAVESWVTPYPKPVILNHNPESEPVGRVMAAKMDSEEDGTVFTRLQLAITDPAAVEKVLSQRYLTGSVGGKAEEALCNICGENWAKPSGYSLPCKHVRGRTYKGKQAVLEMKSVHFKEYSWVNMPADGKSGVRPGRAPAVVAGESDDQVTDDDGWVRPARLFALTMDKEEIFEYTESENRNVLAGMRKKDAAPLYMQLKGAFLSALAVNESEEDDEVDEDTLVAKEEDILNISEELSVGLSTAVNEADSTDDDADEEEVVETPEDEEAEQESETNVAEAGPAPNDPLQKRPEGQEKKHSKDIDVETGLGSPRPRESQDEDVVAEQEIVETDLNEQIKTLESRVEELTAHDVVLSEENARLRSALKRTLVERVVDTKIALALIAREVRETEIEEHLKRSASSLADSLRDLSGMSPTKRALDYSGVPNAEGQGLAVVDTKGGKGKENVITLVPSELQEAKKVNPEDLFVDAFMGRRRL